MDLEREIIKTYTLAFTSKEAGELLAELDHVCGIVELGRLYELQDKLEAFLKYNTGESNAS